MRDGKLITLTLPSFISEAEKQLPPLDQLPFYFPIPPIGSFSRSASANHSEQQVIRRGTISQFGGPDLEEISWSSEFPVLDYFTDSNSADNPPLYADYASRDANGRLLFDASLERDRDGSLGFQWDRLAISDENAYLPSYVLRPPAGFQLLNANISYALLRSLMQAGSVVRLMVEDRPTGRLELDMPVTIRSITLKEEGGEPDTRFYDIAFRQYRYNVIRTVKRGGEVTSGGTGRAPVDRMVVSPFKPRQNTGIQTLAMAAYHDRTMWKEIVKANGYDKGMRKRGAIFDAGERNGPWILPKGKSFVVPGKLAGIGFVPKGTPPPLGI